MKRLALLAIIFIGSFIFFIRTHAPEKAQQVAQHVVTTTAIESSPTPIPVGLPETITIPRLNIYAQVESVGMDAEGRMGVPQNNIDTAWYKYGYRPGEKGSAVIDGHFDTPTGAPAVFYSIAKLQPGDTITVTDTSNRKYNFTVTQVASYPFDQLPMQQIFASNDKPRLNLITCDGTWSRTEHNYSNRAVVYSVLDQ